MKAIKFRRGISLLLVVLMSGVLLLCAACSGGNDQDETEQPTRWFDYTKLKNLSDYVSLSDAVFAQGVSVPGSKDMDAALYQEWLGSLLLSKGKRKLVTDRPAVTGETLSIHFKGVFENADGSETEAVGIASMNFSSPTLIQLGDGDFDDDLIGITPEDTYRIDEAAAVTEKEDIVCVSYKVTYVPHNKTEQVTQEARRMIVDLKNNKSLPEELLQAFTGKTVGESNVFDIALDLDKKTEGAETAAHCEMTVHGIVKLDPVILYTTVPESYASKPEYAGKDIKFYVWVAGITQPDFDALTPEFVRDELKFEPEEGETDIVAAYKKQTYAELLEEYENTRCEVVLEAVQAAVKETAVYPKLPEAAVRCRLLDVEEELQGYRSYYEKMGKKFDSEEAFVKFYYNIESEEPIDVPALLREKAEGFVREDLLFYRLSHMCGLSVGEQELQELLQTRMKTLAEKYAAEDKTGKTYTVEEAKAKYESIYGVGFAEYTLQVEILEKKLNEYLLENIPVTYTGNT